MNIGDTYQRETKYSRSSMGGGFTRTEETAEPFKHYPDVPVVSLPVPHIQDPGLCFSDLLAKRRSRRDFTASDISLETLSFLVHATQGVTAKTHGYLFRTAPSAGALYPVETYIMVNHVTGIDRGIYHLNIPDNSLEYIIPGDYAAQLAVAALGQDMVRTSSITFIWTGIPGRSKWKYRERAYRYIYLDAGHIAQNLYLAAEYTGHGCCTIGAFFDDEVSEIVGIDGVTETAVYLGAVGTL